MKTTPTTPRETLAQDAFKIEQPLALFGRPIGCLLSGIWGEDGAAEGVLGLVALEPLDLCRLVASWRFLPGEPLMVARASDPADPRDDTGVIERFFERPLDQILAAVFGQLHDAFAAAAELRDDQAGEAPTAVH